jgi:hypothetical protein
MGNRANSVLCYGIYVSEDNVPWNDEKFEYDLDEYVVWKLTGKNWGDLPDGVASKTAQDWYKEHDVDFRRTGSCDYVEGILCMRPSVTHTDWDGPIEVEPAKMTLFDKEKWKGTLKTVCEFLGVEYKEPRWLLGSYWG